MNAIAVRSQRGQTARATATAMFAIAAWASAGCDPDPTALIDSLPIALVRAPIGGGQPGDGPLVARAGYADGTAFDMVIDSGSVVTALGGTGGVVTIRSGFDLFDAASTPPAALRASFRNHQLIRMPIAAIGDGSMVPMGILGGTLLRGYSVELRFGATCPAGRCSSLTFWHHVGADASFLADSGFAVYRFALYGGGEYTANGNADFLGLRGPLVLPPTRVLMRTCAVPSAFVPLLPGAAAPPPACCTAKDAADQATGTELALLLATGVGPLVLSQRAWDRVARNAMALATPVTLVLPPDATDSLFIATWPTAIRARWSSIPRIAFVDAEVGGGNDPGACVELGRARRTEQVSFLTVMDPESRACTQPCDVDTRERGKAQSSAAYLEVGGSIPVAVVEDDAAFLQALRFDVRPEGPELDGLVGAGVFGQARMELDYLSTQPRALMSCETDAPRAECWAAARCPRLPDHDSVHYCFGYGPHRLPTSCEPVTCAAP